MKFAALLLLPCLACAQPSNATSGPCSPIVLNNTGTVSINCPGLTKQQGDDLLKILNRILTSQTDLKQFGDKVDLMLKELAKQQSPVINQHSEGPNSPNVVGNGNTFISQDADTIRSLELRVELDIPTVATKTNDDAESLAFMSRIAFVDSEDTLYIFGTEGRFQDWQMREDTHRLGAIYKPVNPQQFAGRPISLLSRMNRLVLDYGSFVKMTLGSTLVDTGTANFQLHLFLNGIDVATCSASPSMTVLLGKQSTMNISEGFVKLPQVYTQAIADRAKQQ